MGACARAHRLTGVGIGGEVTADCANCGYGCMLEPREGAAGTCPKCGAGWALVIEWTAKGDEVSEPEGQKEKQN